MLGELINKEADKAILDEDLTIFVDLKLLNGDVLMKADDIRREYEASTGVSLKVWRVR